MRHLDLGEKHLVQFNGAAGVGRGRRGGGGRGRAARQEIGGATALSVSEMAGTHQCIAPCLGPVRLPATSLPHYPSPHQLISQAGQRFRGAEAHRMTTGQRRGRQTPLAGTTAVVGDAEGAALVVIQSAACWGRQTTRDTASRPDLNLRPARPLPLLKLRNPVDPREGLHSVIKFNRKVQEPNLSRTSNGPEPSRMKVWAPPPGKYPRAGEVGAEGNGNVDWVVEEGSHNHVTSCRTDNYTSYEYLFAICACILKTFLPSSIPLSLNILIIINFTS